MVGESTHKIPKQEVQTLAGVVPRIIQMACSLSLDRLQLGATAVKTTLSPRYAARMISNLRFVEGTT